jgi:hypothetical protein
VQDLFNFSDSERDPEYIPDSTGDTGSETDNVKVTLQVESSELLDFLIGLQQWLTLTPLLALAIC